MKTQDLTTLSNDHTRVMLLLNEYEWLESVTARGEFQHISLDLVRAIEQMMINDAESLTGQIYDLKHRPGEVEDEEEDSGQDMAEAIMDELNGEYDPSSRIDLDEGVLRQTTKDLYIPLWERDWEVTHKPSN